MRGPPPALRFSTPLRHYYVCPHCGGIDPTITGLGFERALTDDELERHTERFFCGECDLVQKGRRRRGEPEGEPLQHMRLVVYTRPTEGDVR